MKVPSTRLLKLKMSSFQGMSATDLPSNLTDKALYRLCQLYGSNAKTWLRKFAGLLPEVSKRQLHRHHGCGSIQEFAKKLAGMNEITTDKILNLHKRLQGKPNLLKLFESGEQGWSKLEKVAFIATTENEKNLAVMVENLPQKALEQYVQSERQKIEENEITLKSEVQNELQIPQVPSAYTAQDQQIQAIGGPSLQAQLLPITLKYNYVSVPGQPFVEKFTTFSFHLSQKSQRKLNLIKHDLEKTYKKTLTWNDVIDLLPSKNLTIIKKVCPSCAKRAQQNSVEESPRPIPSQIQKLVLFRHGRTCVFPGCNRAYTEFHHIKPYAIHKSHNPAYIFPVCSIHHTLFHAGLIENGEKLPRFWCLRSVPQQTALDKKVMRFKMLHRAN